MKHQDGPPGAPRPMLSRRQICASEADIAKRLLREQTQGIHTLRGEVLDAVVDGLLEDIRALDRHASGTTSTVEATAYTDDHCPKLRLVGTHALTVPDDEPVPPSVQVPWRVQTCDSPAR